MFQLERVRQVEDGDRYAFTAKNVCDANIDARIGFNVGEFLWI